MNNHKERGIYIVLLIFLCLASLGLVFYVFNSQNLREAKPLPISSTLVFNSKFNPYFLFVDSKLHSNLCIMDMYYQVEHLD